MIPNLPESKLTKRQKCICGPVSIQGWGPGALIKAIVRFDDECGNGHNSFTVTGEIYIPGRRDCEACGMLHEEIAKYFPQLEPLLKWHLCSTDGPMHYIGNTMYLAGDRDCWGLRKGEFRQFLDKKSGLPLWELDAKYSDFGAYKAIASETVPAPVTFTYKPFGQTGEGKDRELDAARRAAIWPEATNEELTSSDLKQRLIDRLPALMQDFKAAVESLGFEY